MARIEKTKIEVIYYRVILRLSRHVTDTVCGLYRIYQMVIIFRLFGFVLKRIEVKQFAFHGSGVMKKHIPGVAVLSPLYDYRLWVLIRVLDYSQASENSASAKSSASPPTCFSLNTSSGSIPNSLPILSSFQLRFARDSTMSLIFPT